MIEFIPTALYTPLYHYVLLLVVFITLLHTYAFSMTNKMVVYYNQNFGIFVFMFVLFYMGLRPISGVFIDMTTYNRAFEGYAGGGAIVSEKDIFFQIFTKFLSGIVSASTYFFICATLYVIPIYLVCKKWFRAYWLYGFLFIVGAFSFWAYGVNGIRNGIAGSLFLLGISREKRLWQVVWFLFAVGFHKTMLLPIAGFILANFYNRPKAMIAFWLFTIPVSLIGGGVFEEVFGAIGFDDDRMRYFTEEVQADSFSNIGFRWDFLTYSATAVLAGWYYIFKKGYKDKIYFWLFNTYVFTNAFWILVIRANFSNRFAYLSWFMIGLVIIYPLLKNRMLVYQHRWVGLILLAYFGFTFLLNVLLT